MIKLTRSHIIGLWQSTSEIEVLDYESNFSNWIGASPIPGFHRFLVEWDDLTKRDIAKVQIPIAGHGGGTGHYDRYFGNFEFDEYEIRIWQNEQLVVRIRYIYDEQILYLKLFSKTIPYKKEQQ